MDWYEIIGVILIPLVCFLAGYIYGKRLSKDDGIAIINEERVEVIFRDPYEKLIKKKFVNLRIQS